MIHLAPLLWTLVCAGSSRRRRGLLFVPAAGRIVFHDIGLYGREVSIGVPPDTSCIVLLNAFGVSPRNSKDPRDAVAARAAAELLSGEHADLQARGRLMAGFSQSNRRNRNHPNFVVHEDLEVIAASQSRNGGDSMAEGRNTKTGFGAGGGAEQMRSATWTRVQ
jgi:hypothetical protein